ncbi:MAG: peptide deformylase, partial [Candidatus Buchananbacteria bacterium]|nr:peptide deformylase [Candidatus Buchananbacteria bacterium]
DLIDSMRHHGLVGMAAPQVGKNVRIFVTEIRKTKFRTSEVVNGELRIYINPTIIAASKKMVSGWEGCGSVASANLFGRVKRSVAVTIEAFDERGDKFQFKATDLLARVIQHEMDHLNGIVFTDTADPKTYMSRNEYLAMKLK